MHRLAILVALVGLGACGSANDADGTTATTTSAASAASMVSTEPPTTMTEPVATSSPAPTAAVATGPTATSPTTESFAAIAAEALIGRWAHYDVVAYEDGVIKTLIISYGFNDFDAVDGQIVDTAEFCFSEQRTDQPIQTSLSDAATQAIKPPPTPVEVDAVGGVLRIRRPATPTPVGIRLDDPFEESLPTDPDDPRIVDDDGDGKPGITVKIVVGDDLTGEIYIARREIFAYEAFLSEPDLLTGTVTDDSEQLIIGASDPIFAVASEWVQHPDPAKSPIILRRVDHDWDCDRLARERDDLFPPTPSVDW